MKSRFWVTLGVAVMIGLMLAASLGKPADQTAVAAPAQAVAAPVAGTEITETIVFSNHVFIPLACRAYERCSALYGLLPSEGTLIHSYFLNLNEGGGVFYLLDGSRFLRPDGRGIGLDWDPRTMLRALV